MLFYIFSLLVITAAVGVISVKNPVHAVFFLIFAFFNVAGLFVLLGAEFLAMALVIIYVGAVAILFLFVVMMLNVGLLNIKQYVVNNRKLLLILSLLLAAELVFIIYSSIAVESTTLLPKAPLIIEGTHSNTHQLGLLLYTEYAYLFQICGFILFAAIIAAIILTHRDGRNKIKQDINTQLKRNKANSIAIVNVKSNTGVNVIDRD